MSDWEHISDPELMREACTEAVLKAIQFVLDNHHDVARRDGVETFGVMEIYRLMMVKRHPSYLVTGMTPDEAREAAERARRERADARWRAKYRKMREEMLAGGEL